MTASRLGAALRCAEKLTLEERCGVTRCYMFVITARLVIIQGMYVLKFM